jgi:hypothetical protein
MDLVAQIWQIEPSRVDYFFNSYKPHFQFSKHQLKIGRVSLAIQEPQVHSSFSFSLSLLISLSFQCLFFFCFLSFFEMN